jgi:hypothetical protein
MKSNKSFIEKMNDANYGKRGMYIAGVTILAILIVKLFVVPVFEPLHERPFFRNVRFWNNLIENIAIFNIAAFFLCIVFFKEKIGHKLLYAMQLKDKNYFKEKWVLLWLKSLWISIAIIGVTTVISQALFKSWMSFIWLILFLCIPFYMLPKIKSKLTKRF